MSDVLNEIRVARDHFRSAVNSGLGVAKRKETLLNILLTHVDVIIEAFETNDELMKELNSANDQIASLIESANNKSKPSSSKK